MRVAILGYGSEGRAAYNYWQSPNNQITICDKDESVDLPIGAGHQLGPDYLKNLAGFDLIVHSPGVHPGDITAANSPAILAKVTTGLNEFFRVCSSKNVIGITGTKGKGTTSTLTAKMLEAIGRTVHLGGNIGVAPLDVLRGNIQPDDWVVLELSSFQLIDLRFSPHIAVCLMVVPEHLNWHADMEEYAGAKQQLFAHQTPDDVAIYFAGNEHSQAIAGASPGRKIPYFAPPALHGGQATSGALVQDNKIVIGDQTICRTDELKLLGRHNWQNVCAAITAVWQVDQNIDAIRSVLTTFTGLPHRLELVRELHGVKYYDDSFGTTPETAIVAIKAFTQPEIVILGGRGKGVPFDNLAKTVAARPNIKNVIAIGETGSEIAELLKNSGYQNVVDGGNKIQAIVELAQKLAASGDVVLLSTACTSFDMFDNYKQRGERFSQAVQALV